MDELLHISIRESHSPRSQSYVMSSIVLWEAGSQNTGERHDRRFLKGF